MKFADLLKLYEEKKSKYDTEAYRHISEMLDEAKELHKKIGLSIRLPREIMNNRGRVLKEKTLKSLLFTL